MGMNVIEKGSAQCAVTFFPLLLPRLSLLSLCVAFRLRLISTRNSSHSNRKNGIGKK